MTDFEYYDPPDGYCENCGQDLSADPRGEHDEHHRLCWECWRGEQDIELEQREVPR